MQQTTQQTLQQEIAEVSSTDGDYVLLKTSNKTSCGECASKASCGSVKFFKPLVDNDVIKIKNTLDLKEGDSVILALPPSKLLLGTFLVYLFPLFSLMIFAILGKMISGEGLSILMGLAGLGLSLVLVSKFVKRKEVSQQFTPKILEKS
jgi:sigma-E factor negative regulatory protein RseC